MNDLTGNLEAVNATLGSIVYDVVQHVRPGSLTSTTPGTWLVAFFLTEDAANDFAATCNGFRVVDGIEFSVEAHRELSPDRRQYEADRKRDHEPTPPPVCGGSPEVAEVEAPVKVKPRSADSIILEAIEASRKAANGYEGEAIRAVLGSATPGQRAAVTKKLKGYGKGNVRTEIFLYTCASGYGISFPQPVAQVEATVEATAVEAGNASPIEGPFVDEANRVAKGLRTLVADKLPATCFEPHPHPWYNSYTITKMVQEQVKGVSFYTASLAVQEHFPMLFCPVEAAPVDPVTGDTAPLMGEAQAPLTGKTPPLVGGPAVSRKMTASDYDVNLDDIRKEGWDLRYFTIAQRAIRDGALEVLASSDYGCSVHGPGRDTYGDTDDDEQADFLAWLRIIRSPIRLTARNFSQAWDEFIVDCREGTPVGFPVTPLPDDDLDAMRSIFEETIHPDATENARWSASSSSRMTTDSDGTSRCEIPTESYSGDRPRRATEDARLSIPSDTGSSVRRPPSGAATTDTRKTPSDATIDPEETLVDIPMEGDYGYCWGDDDTRLVGDSVDHDHHDPDGYYSPWMRPAYEPMELDDYEAMLALGLAF